MSFFNEFPHTRTYDSDLAWLIKRMKEVLSRMDSVEERMAALENLVNEFIKSLNLDTEVERVIKEYLLGNEFINLISDMVSTNLEGYFKIPTHPTETIRLERETDYTIETYNTNAISVAETQNGFSVDVLDLGGFWGLAISPQTVTGTGVLTLRISALSGNIVQPPLFTLTETGSNKFSNYLGDGSFILTEPLNRFLISLLGRGASVTLTNNGKLLSFRPEYIYRYTPANPSSVSGQQSPIVLGTYPKKL